MKQRGVYDVSGVHVFRSSMRRGIGSRYSNRHEPAYLSGKFWCIIIASRCMLKGILIGRASHAFFPFQILNFQPLRGVYPYSVRVHYSRGQTGIPPSNAEKKHMGTLCAVADLQSSGAVPMCGISCGGVFPPCPSNRPGLGLHVRVTTVLICRA